MRRLSPETMCNLVTGRPSKELRKRLRAINESRPQKRKADQVYGVPLSDSQLAKPDVFPVQRPCVGDFRKKWIEVHWAILFNGEKVLVKVLRPGLNSANEDWQEKLEMERMKHNGEKVLVKVQRPDLNSGREDWQEKLEIRQIKLDMEIMIMDTSGLTPIQQEYFHLRQMEILENCLNSHHHWNVFL
ncbi:uncharacterized protein LOC132186239 isoform X5 [Corylus avellana]|uniref:uncharacterized protein LOC132186239 isoform X5 n=1 Tax=Corylus avellana TaxID=13451 RepID=UPI00286A029B|nr:uncharacterized protein LOC132186239 isoform X5 [Corylus avellana]